MSGLDQYPRRVGGAPGFLEEIYLGLRAAMGETEGHAMGPPAELGGLEDCWRLAKAMGLAMSTSAEEAAALEFFPISSRFGLAAWQRQLGLAPAETDVQSRAEFQAVYTSPSFADLPSLRAKLRSTFGDDSITIVPHARTVQVETYFHRGLADRTGAPYRQDGVGVANAPHYSTAYVLIVTWPIASITPANRLLMSRLLRRALPAHVNFEIITSTGFVLGVSLLGEVAFE